jgi:hypothetical protein
MGWICSEVFPPPRYVVTIVCGRGPGYFLRTANPEGRCFPWVLVARRASSCTGKIHIKKARGLPAPRLRYLPQIIDPRVEFKSLSYFR